MLRLLLGFESVTIGLHCSTAANGCSGAVPDAGKDNDWVSIYWALQRPFPWPTVGLVGYTFALGLGTPAGRGVRFSTSESGFKFEHLLEP